ncbi:hypothetical protein [Azoarcus olearius]|uniref:Hypothetical secreted protein n=1 Tax=Azoarcus sp. (strain BH72) TaxID=418699 RepID=A1K832_AZOSB|nr:hypothetical protein [Azoarcus olearius]CAL94987.1 hypothetical secreted protein [Azoarcus olearius]
MKTSMLALCAAFTLSACSTLIGPSAGEIAALPVVSYGQPAPQGEFVLRYPAGTDLPFNASVGGSLLTEAAQSTLKVRVKQDIYVYKDKLSFDGKTWSAARSKIGGEFRISPPGMKDGQIDPQAPGEMSAMFNAR